ncbi:hypothetical protein LX32DRAFT_260777 [Colletotrichum zoysiae]|uniref:Secreted protein n=1 Tax=Colletotrichum zoysiae TaxID=1216348 RepID=A0AAD9H2Q8_9PEZI|nr:hypothetical protein LX32DRAFT_260777 [Colletotrichum zoysiae]
MDSYALLIAGWVLLFFTNTLAKTRLSHAATPKPRNRRGGRALLHSHFMYEHLHLRTLFRGLRERETDRGRETGDAR